MKIIKTNKTYSESIRKKYISDVKSGKLRVNLYNLTRSNIRNVCVSIVDNNLSAEDEKTMRNYFEIIRETDLRQEIKKYDIGGFRPIYNFLKGNIGSIKSNDALELIAVIVDYEPRPYKNYRFGETLIKSNQSVENKDIVNENIRKQVITVKPSNRELFTWFSNVSTFNKLMIFSCVLLLSISIMFTTNYVLSNRVKWMVWQGDHYEEVEFDDEKYNINQLKYYKEDRIKYFNKVDPICEYKFFNEDGSVRIWYGKNKNKVLEYFTDYGLHPETGKTLKPISKYMIDKYICN